MLTLSLQDWSSALTRVAKVCVDSTVDFAFAVSDSVANGNSRRAGKEKKVRSLGSESY